MCADDAREIVLGVERGACAAGRGRRLAQVQCRFDQVDQLVRPIAFRLARLSDPRAASAFISTIHSFCARVLRAHALLAGMDVAQAGDRGETIW